MRELNEKELMVVDGGGFRVKCRDYSAIEDVNFKKTAVSAAGGFVGGGPKVASSAVVTDIARQLIE